MGRYLDILRRLEAEPHYDRNDIYDQSPVHPPQECTFGRFGRFGRTCQELERRCPDLVEVDRWQLAVREALLATEALLDGEAEAITRVAVERAKEGDATALRLCLERILPPRKDRPVSFSLPNLKP
jgi:hypothetical protein